MDIARWPERVRGVDQDRLDLAFAVALAAVSLAGLLLTPSAMGGRAPDLVSVGLVLAMTLPLAIRRREPMRVLGIVGLATIAYALSGPFGSLNIGILVAMYSVAANAPHEDAVRALTWTLVGATVSFVGIWIYEPAISLGIWLSQVVLVWVVFVVSWLMGDLVRSRGEAVKELEQRNAELVAEREENARLAVADERARIARDLHDAVAHNVSVMVVQAAAARRSLEHEQGVDPPPAAARAHEALATIEATGRDTLTEMRRVVGALRPTADEAYEPQPSLAELPRLLDAIRDSGLAVELVVDGTPQPLAHGVDLAAYRVVQEALTNTLKHAHAASATVSLRYAPEAIDIEVTDDGRGAAARLLEPAHRGYGIVGMRERVSTVGGELEAEPRTGGGFRVHARLPLEPVA